MSCRFCSREWICGGLGLILFMVGAVLYIKWIAWFTILRGKEMALSLKSPAYSGWKQSPLPLYLDIYLFNWTNSHQFTNHSVKPRFQELGPYRFRDIPDKVDINFHPKNNSVTFRKMSLYYFDAEGSNGSLSDILTTVNMVAWAAVHKKRDSGFFEMLGLKTALDLSNEGLTVTKTVDEMLFSGYKDPMVDLNNVLRTFSIGEDSIDYDRVGYFYKRNGSAVVNGLLNMHTGGGGDYKNMGQIHTWNHKNHTGFYESHCGKVSGSLGEFFPPNLKEGDTVEMFIPNMCRTVPLDYTETVEIHGVKGLKFSGGRRSVDNGTMYPETKCFCVDGKCERVGLMNLGPCQYGTTTFMSYPHFYEADPYYLEQIEGLNPIKEKHEFFMTLEPNAGVPLDVGGGFQANVLIDRVPGMGIYDKARRILLPIMWCEERVRVTPEIAAEIQLVPQIIYWGQIVAGVILLVGIVLFCWHPFHSIKNHFTPKDQRKPRATWHTMAKRETIPFVDKNDTGQINMHPKKLSLLGQSRETDER